MKTLYIEKMTEQLKQLPLSVINEWAGRDIGNLSEFSNNEIPGSLHVYQTDLAEKIAIGSISVNNEVNFGFCTIIPRSYYAVPIYVSRWEERQNTITIMVDFMPTVDMIVDEAYRVKFLESMGESWERFSNLPGICPEEDNDLRSACSIIYTAACVPIEKDGMRLAALAPHLDYLKKYIAFMDELKPLKDDVKQKEVARRITAVRSIFKSNLQNTFSNTAGLNLGKELTELFCTALT
jgi:hypothetical protein